MEARTYTLKEPIKNGAETIDALVFKAPKAKHFRQFPAQGATLGDILNLMGKLCDQPPSVIDELSAEDLAEASAIVAGFIPGGLGAGEKP
jgi:hypothetical protein